jgi:protein-S-isoprenylcysteine O-methyltransferase Ste14
MEQIIKIGLPIYFVIFFGVAFVLKSFFVAKRIGKNPLVLPKDDSAYGLIGLYFKLTMIGLFCYTVLYSLVTNFNDYLLSIKSLEIQNLKYVGIGIMIIALIWTIVAQNHMKESWRIGIDTETKTELITIGLFGISRNPIFLGMILSLIGLFLLTPNAWTLLFMILGYVLIQIQIRLEEEFLTEQHGEKYISYKEKVRRLI